MPQLISEQSQFKRLQLQTSKKLYSKISQTVETQMVFFCAVQVFKRGETVKETYKTCLRQQSEIEFSLSSKEPMF